MEQQTAQIQSEPKTIVIVVITVMITALLTGGVVYVWQQAVLRSVASKGDRTIEVLRKEINELKNQPQPTPVTKVAEKIIEVTTAPTQPTPVPQTQVVSDVVLPQVYFQTRMAFSQKDIDDIQAKVVKPLVAYYEKQGQKVVSVTIEKAKAAGYDIGVTAIIARDKTSNDPIVNGFLYKKEGSSYPLWQPEEVPAGYQG